MEEIAMNVGEGTSASSKEKNVKNSEEVIDSRPSLDLKRKRDKELQQHDEDAEDAEVEFIDETDSDVSCGENDSRKLKGRRIRPISPPRVADRYVRICKPHEELDGDSAGSDEDDDLVVEKLHSIWFSSTDEKSCKDLLKKVGSCRSNFFRFSTEERVFYAFLTMEEAAKMADLTSAGVHGVIPVEDMFTH